MDLSKLNELDLNDIDFKKIGIAPWPIKGALIAVTCIAVLVAGYFLVITGQLDTLKRAKSQEQSLRQTFTTKQAKASNLGAYKQQLTEMKTSFGALLRQLPNKTEIETLLTDITQTGISSGLTIDYFKPEGLVPKEFYAEFPIKLKVTGHYHQFAQFVSGVAALPRIVTLKDFDIENAKGTKGGSPKLEMEVTAVTYQYLDEAERDKLEGGKGKKGARDRRSGRRK